MNHPRQGIANLVHRCHMKGMKAVILSPGSRNAPLIKAFTAYPGIHCHSVVDERSAGYMALGMAIASGHPVGVCCTSGTAVLNYGPAIAEAYYQGVPLIVITADRPGELIDQGDGQAIRQQNVFANYIKASYQLPEETDTAGKLWHADRLVAEAIDMAVLAKPGPVHFNVPMHEPLYDDLPEANTGESYSSLVIPKSATAPLPVELARQWQSSRRKMIIIGYQQHNKALQHSLEALLHDPSTVVVAENLANQPHEQFISAVERLFFALESHNLLPDHIICLGGDVLSKQAKKTLRQHPPRHNWNVAEYYNPKDTFQSLKEMIQASPASLIAQLAALPEGNTSYRKEVLALDGQLEELQHQSIKNIDFCDLKAMAQVMANLPTPCNLHLGNSSPVRYAQLFRMQDDITYFSNRGVSGIDGPLSTAMGVALESTRLNVLIIGEISFLYDSNALWFKHFPKNLKIIVMQNNGGDIFRIIDTGQKLKEIEEYFTTPPTVNFGMLTQACGLGYITANSEPELNSALTKLFDPKENITVLEVNTKSRHNSKALQQLYHLFKTYKI